MEVSLLVFLAFPLSVYLIHIIHRLIYRNVNNPAYQLTLRKLQVSGADMLKGSQTHNVFLDEYNLLTDLLFPKLDFCVMKALDQDIPLLSRQEHLHAKMHNEAQKERVRLEHGLSRWGWYIFLADLFLLRMGRHVGCAMAGFAEATSGVWFTLPMMMSPTKDFMNNEYAYHALEELEHGPLTTQYLRHQVSPLLPLLLYPVIVIVYTIYFLGPPVMAFLVQPSLALRMGTYKELACYYASMIPVCLITLYTSFTFWVLPFREEDALHQERYAFFQKIVQDRKIPFEEISKETYRVDAQTGKVQVL